ncbi:MAG: SAM-dependent methyltransferase [Bacilli bacterium]|nr:SAM-dependent methyltransferase [Bacilli bacterium]
MIKISERLKSISEFIEDNTNILDIGCDHGLLDIYLMQNKNNINITATEINKEALNNAIKNFKKNKLDNKIKTIHTNGLDNIDTTNINTIIIAGMGSHTIVGILYKNIKKLKNIDNLILQSNNDIDFLRKKITKIGYYIEKEKLIKDKNIIYTIIQFKKGRKIYNRKQLYFGPYLLKENSILFKDKNKEDLIKLNKIYKLIPKKYILYKIKTLYKINLYKNLPK